MLHHLSCHICLQTENKVLASQVLEFAKAQVIYLKVGAYLIDMSTDRLPCSSTKNQQKLVDNFLAAI